MKNKYAIHSYRYLFVWNPLETDLFPSCLKHYFKLNLVLKIQKYNLQDFSQYIILTKKHKLKTFTACSSK